MNFFPGPDAATALTKQYVEVLASRLNCTFLDNGEVVVLPLNVTPSAVAGLARDLAEILSGTPLANAFSATKTCGELFVQSVAFGAIPDFDLALKVGLLYSRRIVLWDVLSNLCHQIAREIGRRGIPPLRLENSIAEHIALLAGNILRAKSMVDSGVLVMLPHPLSWSEEATQTYAKAARGFLGVFWGTSIGTLLATTISVSKELALHPYSIDPEASPLWLDDSLSSLAFSRQNRLMQKSFVEILETPAFEYLGDISLKNFHELLRGTPFLAEELRHLLGELAGATEQQWRERIQFARGKIQDELQRSIRLEEFRKALGVAGPLTGAAMASAGDGVTGLKVILGLLGPFMESSAAGLEPLAGEGVIVGFLSRARRLAEDDRLIEQIAKNPLAVLRP